jgi:hypothetical protein
VQLLDLAECSPGSRKEQELVKRKNSEKVENEALNLQSVVEFVIGVTFTAEALVDMRISPYCRTSIWL